jgi:hypothetical protein
MPKNRSGHDIWFEWSFGAGFQVIRTEGFVLSIVGFGGAFFVGFGGIWLGQHSGNPLMAIVALLMSAIAPIWGIGALVLLIRHTGPYGSSWKN